MSDVVLPCPKCGARSWIHQDPAGDWQQKCYCGYLGFLIQHKDGLQIMKAAVASSDIGLPRVNTKIYRCLVAMTARYPHPSKTAEVASSATLERAETSSLLISLMSQGLIERVEERKGKDGGSIWKLTGAAEKLLNLRSR